LPRLQTMRFGEKPTLSFHQLGKKPGAWLLARMAFVDLRHDDGMAVGRVDILSVKAAMVIQRTCGNAASSFVK